MSTELNLCSTGVLRGELRGELQGELQSELQGELQGELQRELQGELQGIVDSHFHSEYLSEKGLDPKAQLNLAFSQGFEGGIDIGCTSSDLPRRYELLKAFSKVVLAGAMGPWELDEISSSDKPFVDTVEGSAGSTESAAEASSVEKSGAGISFDEIDARLDVLRSNLIKYKAKILGEIGLDYYWNYGTVEKQLYLFKAQLKMASSLNLPVSIHDRMADSDTIATISQFTPPKAGIIHCFDGCEPLMKVALDLGYFISFAGNLTFKKNTELREILKKVPRDRLLFETDAPYLTPVPHRGEPNTPLYVVHTYECASQVLNISMKALSEQVLNNYNALLAR